jgi:UPF0288 family protein (methanogenesis marker protein 3)
VTRSVFSLADFDPMHDTVLMVKTREKTEYVLGQQKRGVVP